MRDYGTGEWTGGDKECDHVSPYREECGVCGRCGACRVDSQLGLEATPELYVERMVAVFREVWRVLRDDGTVWLNLGDSYAGAGYSNHANTGGAQREDGGKQRHALISRANGAADNVNSGSPVRHCAGDRAGVGGGRDDAGALRSDPARRSRNGDAGFALLKNKDLVGVPWRVAFALQADGWYLRSDIVWSKPNPMPESVVDRPTKAHEMLFLLAKRPRYFYDADAIREPHVDPERGANGQHVGSGPDERPEPGVRTGTMLGIDRAGPRAYNPAGRNRRSVWTIATEPFPEAHFATYPQALVRPCIQAGTSERGECSECGAPWVREVERTNERVGADRGGNYAGRTVEGYERREDGSLREIAGAARPQRVMQGGYRPGARYVTNDLGWKPSCGCVGESASGSYPDTGKRFVVSEPPPTRPQLVLDPFIGSGTTALVARNHGRRCIGIDLSAEYLAIAAKRLQQLSLLGGAA